MSFGTDVQKLGILFITLYIDTPVNRLAQILHKSWNPSVNQPSVIVSKQVKSPQMDSSP